MIAASCGGPYTPKKTNLPGDKLALADRLFAKGSYDEAALEYKDFLATFAGDERIDYAQFRLAESYRCAKEYALAEVEYRILINDYNYSEYVDDCYYLEALCCFKQAPRVERDQTKTYEALDRLNRFVQLYPSSSRLPEARAAIHEAHLRLGEKDFIAAKLYFSKKAYDASLIYLNKIIDLDSETIWAARSFFYRGRIRETRGERAAAVDEYRKALSIKGEYPERADSEKRLKLLEAQTG